MRKTLYISIRNFSASNLTLLTFVMYFNNKLRETFKSWKKSFYASKVIIINIKNPSYGFALNRVHMEKC